MARLREARAPAIVMTHGLASRLTRGSSEQLSMQDLLLLPRLQSHQDGLFQAESLPKEDRSSNHYRTLGCNRLRKPHASSPTNAPTASAHAAMTVVEVNLL